MSYPIVNYSKESEKDKQNYAYAVCECLPFCYGIKVPKNKNKTFEDFECPNCGEKLGLYVGAKKVNIFKNIY